MRRLILVFAMIGIALLITSLPPATLGCAPVSCGCDCTPDAPDIGGLLPDIDLGPDVDVGRDRDEAPPREEKDAINAWVIIGPAIAILVGASAAAYVLGTRRR